MAHIGAVKKAKHTGKKHTNFLDSLKKLFANFLANSKGFIYHHIIGLKRSKSFTLKISTQNKFH